MPLSRKKIWRRRRCGRMDEKTSSLHVWFRRNPHDGWTMMSHSAAVVLSLAVTAHALHLSRMCVFHLFRPKIERKHIPMTTVFDTLLLASSVPCGNGLDAKQVNELWPQCVPAIAVGYFLGLYFRGAVPPVIFGHVEKTVGCSRLCLREMS